MKCEVCKEEIDEHFLHKMKGTYIKIDGKLKAVCNHCQSKHKDNIKAQL